jgi:hypothetical protein
MKYYEILCDKIMNNPCGDEVIMKRFLDQNKWRLPYVTEVEIIRNVTNRTSEVFAYHSLKRGGNLVEYFKDYDKTTKIRKFILGKIVLPIASITKEEYDLVCNENVERGKSDWYNQWPGRCVFTSGPDGFDRTNFGLMKQTICNLAQRAYENY